MEDHSPSEESTPGEANEKVSSRLESPIDATPSISKSAWRVLGCLGVATIMIAILITVAVTAGIVLVRDYIAKQQWATADGNLRNGNLGEKEAALRAVEENEVEEWLLREQIRLRELSLLREQERLEKQALLKEEEKKREAKEMRRLQALALAEEQAKFEKSLISLSAALKEYKRNSGSGFLIPNGGEAGSGLSWRVHCLPFIGQGKVYEKFRLDEPWDSVHNRRLLSESPVLYRCSEDGKTRIRCFLNVDGKGWPFLTEADVLDPLRETILIFCAKREQSIEWTRPDDLEQSLGMDVVAQLVDLLLNDGNPVSKAFTEKNRVLMCDFSYQEIDADTTVDKFFPLVTHNQQEIVGFSVRDSLLTVSAVQEKFSNSVVSDSSDEASAAKEKLVAISKALKELRKGDSSSQRHIENRGISWRVHLLPFIGENELYKRFHLNETWDSPHNFSLLTEIPELYRLGAAPAHTRFCLLGTEDIADGVWEVKESNQSSEFGPTVEVLFTGRSRSILWTKPDDLVVQVDRFAESLGWLGSNSIPSCTTTGEFLLLPPKLHPTKVTALIYRSADKFFDLGVALAEPEKSLRLKVEVKPAAPIAGAIQLPSVPPVKLPATNSESPHLAEEERMRRVAIAIANCHVKFRYSPFNRMTSSKAPSGLSWRVHILPFLGQQALYGKFALDESWDSPTNLEAASTMPEVYGVPAEQDGRTDICALRGPDALLSTEDMSSRCSDGVGNTIMLVQVSKDRRVPWTRPEDIELSNAIKFSELVGSAPHLRIALGDGEPLTLPANFPEPLLQALATARGGELIDGRTIRRLSLHDLGRAVGSIETKSLSERTRLQQVSSAMLRHCDVHGVFPPGLKLPPLDDSKPRPTPLPIPAESYSLSWRVHLLPHLGHESLYRQFRLREPWDSEHNKQLLPYMPDLFRDEGDAADSTTTRMQIVVGKGAAFPETGVAPTASDLTDGYSNTLQLLIVPQALAVPWTQPKDYEVDLETSNFRNLRQGLGIPFCTFDGGCFRLPRDFDVDLLRAMITSKGREKVDLSHFD